MIVNNLVVILKNSQMKKFVLMFIPALICGVVFFSSCNKEESNSALSIYALGQSTTKSATSDESEIGSKGLWCTGNDIIWYNATTGELKLKNIPKVPYWTFFKLTIFLDDIELFSLATVNPISSIGTYFPCISWEPGKSEYLGCKCGNKQDHIFNWSTCEPVYKDYEGRYYISLHYPTWSQEVREGMASVMGQDWLDSLEKEFEAFEFGWNKFIEQLKKEGKYRK